MKTNKKQHKNPEIIEQIYVQNNIINGTTYLLINKLKVSLHLYLNHKKTPTKDNIYFDIIIRDSSRFVFVNSAYVLPDESEISVINEKNLLKMGYFPKHVQKTI